jgi:hypothetical protein
MSTVVFKLGWCPAIPSTSKKEYHGGSFIRLLMVFWVEYIEKQRCLTYRFINNSCGARDFQRR